MRRWLCALLAVVLVFAAAGAANAVSGATRADFSAAVDSNGSCQVTLDVQLHLDSAQDDLTFPLPKEARAVSLNGSSARTRRSGEYLLVDISRVVGKASGDFSLRLQYTLPHVVSYNDLDALEMNIPMLSGFLLPIDSMAFSVTLPGENEQKPAFFSGYYQQSIEADITVTSQTGTVIAGTVGSVLKDRETLTMTLPVTDTLFPQSPTSQWKLGFDDIAMIVLGVAAALYWLLFLRCAPLLGRRNPTGPEGLCAGTYPCALYGRGADLSMLVLAWAQKGYLLIHMKASGRVLLHKRMDMGNERSSYELRIFRALFGKRTVIDTTGYHYSALCRSVAAKKGDVASFFKHRSGNPKVLQVLCAGVGFFGGIAIGNTLSGGAVLGFLLIAVLAVLGAATALVMQQWVLGLHSYQRLYLWLGLGLSSFWLIVGIAAGEAGVAWGMVAAQLLCGLGWGYGGRRTAQGMQAARQVLGLRRYLKTLPAADAQRLMQVDPDHFFRFAPEAMALGVLDPFARRFGNKRLGGCPYLTTGMDGHMTAAEWAQVMHRAVSAMNARQLRLPLERLMGR